MTKKKTWMRFRHRIVRNMAYIVLNPFVIWKYHNDAEPFREQGKRAYLILMNHQTPFDQFFVGKSFKGPVYYVATEDLFSNGIVSVMLRWLVAPIPIQKKKNDMTAIKNCIKVAKEGGTIAIAPEGNRTYSGRTEYMRPAIATLARMINLPIALYRIEGGYGVHPRWSDGVRRGKMHSYVSRVIEPEEYAGMTDEELFAVIRDGLYVDEGVTDGLFTSRKRAEYLERAMYVCPSCGLSKYNSTGNEIECLTCHRKILYGEDKSLSGIGYEFPYQYVSQWYDHQCEYVRKKDLTEFADTPAYTDRASISEVIPYKCKKLIHKDVSVHLYSDRISVEDTMILRFEDVVAASVMGRNKLNIYGKDRTYQIRGSKRFNALKYVNFYYKYKNIVEGDTDGKFLGL